jgi:hypothetical protein
MVKSDGLNGSNGSMFIILKNPTYRAVLAWLWVALISVSIAYVAGRQMIVIERQNNVLVTNAHQSEIDQDHENRIRALEIALASHAKLDETRWKEKGAK